jgi:hypothetical protein
VSRISSRLARIRRRLSCAYHLTCAREDARSQGLRMPLGIWFCEPCRLVMWDRQTFVRHGHVH